MKTTFMSLRRIRFTRACTETSLWAMWPSIATNKRRCKSSFNLSVTLTSTRIFSNSSMPPIQATKDQKRQKTLQSITVHGLQLTSKTRLAWKWTMSNSRRRRPSASSSTCRRWWLRVKRCATIWIIWLRWMEIGSRRLERVLWRRLTVLKRYPAAPTIITLPRTLWAEVK